VRVQGEQQIVYTNNSPDALPSLIFRLYTNAHQAEAIRERQVDAKFLTDGLSVEEFSIDGKAVAWNDPANPLGAEKHWGLFDVQRRPKLAMQ
jgi:hypothetical protein